MKNWTLDLRTLKSWFDLKIFKPNKKDKKYFKSIRYNNTIKYLLFMRDYSPSTIALMLWYNQWALTRYIDYIKTQVFIDIDWLHKKRCTKCDWIKTVDKYYHIQWWTRIDSKCIYCAGIISRNRTILQKNTWKRREFLDKQNKSRRKFQDKYNAKRLAKNLTEEELEIKRESDRKTWKKRKDKANAQRRFKRYMMWYIIIYLSLTIA
jgi:hypothetical protein